MLIQKIPISIFLIITALIFSYSNNEKSLNPNKNFKTFQLDSLISEIKSNGWNDQFLSELKFQITNLSPDLKEEFDKFKKLPDGIEKTYLISLILKKDEKFKEMYDSLSQVLDSSPNFFSYYEELIFAANATNQLTLLESHLTLKKKLNAEYNFLFSLIYSSQNKYNGALDFIQNALKEKPNEKILLYRLSYLYRNAGDLQKAMEVVNDLLENVEKNNSFYAQTLLAKGSLYFLSGDYKNAKTNYEAALKISSSINDKQNQANAIIDLGLIDDVNGNVSSARNKFNEGLKIAENIYDFETIAYAYSELGVSYSYTNELIEAKENYLMSYKIYKKIGNILRLSLLSGNLGKIYQTMFDYKSAIKYYEEGIEFAVENKRAHAINLRGLADVYANLSNYSKALNYYKEAAKISYEIKDLSLQSEINTGIGSLNYNLNHFNTALKFYKKAENLNLNTVNPYLSADIDYKIGLAYYELDSLAKAEKYFDEGIKTAKKSDDFINEAFNTEAIIELYIKENKTAEANKFLDQLDKISVKHSWDLLLAEKFLLEGIINRKQNNFNNAKLNFEKALKKANNLSEFNLKLEAYHLLAKLFEEHHLNEAAESYYNSAIKVIEDVSRPLFQDSDIQISYFAGKRNVYDDYANFLLNKKKYKQAFELIEKTHSRNTIQNLNNLKIGSIVNNEETLNKIYQYDWIINSGIYNKEEVDSVKNLFSELKLSLTKKFPSLKKYLNLSQSLPLKEIQSHIDENQKLLSIYTTENSTYLFLISKDDFKQFEVKISQDKLKKKINAVSSYFGADSNLQKNYYNQDLFSFNAKAANELYKILIEPVIKFINEDDELIIIPSFITASIPFEFLVTKYDDEESPYNYADKKFLIYKYNISYSPSAAVFIEQKTNNFKNKGNVLIVGNPSIDNNSEEYAERRGLLEETGGLPRNVALLPLKYSGEEVQEISKILSSDKVLIEKDATETNFKKNAEFSKVIHLSTHSFLFNKQPLIFFSNAYDPDNDGLLEASEIVQLKLNSDLIVLSSCNSALGSIDESEGIIGMTKAFFEAGSKSVVASLWEVNDKYTSKFMVLFYKRLSEGFDKSKALRLAKIDFIKNYSANPYFWSAFILSGNVSKLDIKKNIEVSKYIVSLLLIIAASVIIFLFIRKKKPLISNL